MALVTDKLYTLGGRSVMSLVATNGVTFYTGALVGIDRATGLAVKWSDAVGVEFLGIALARCVGDGVLEVMVACGQVLERTAVTGAAGVANQGDLVYATDDNTLTTTATTNVGAVGFISRWYTSTLCDIRLFTPEEYEGVMGSAGITFPILAPAGTAAAPSYSFTGAGNADNGMYRSGADAVAIAAGGTKVLEVLTTGVVVTGKLTVTGAIDPTSLTLSGSNAQFVQWGEGDSASAAPADNGRIVYNKVAQRFEYSANGSLYASLVTAFPLRGPDGTAGAPTYSFASDNDTGIMLSAPNAMGLAAGGNVVLSVNDSSVTVAFGGVARARFLQSTAEFRLLDGNFALDTGKIYTPAGSAPTPVYSFTADDNSGMYNIAADTLGWATGGVERMRLDTSNLTLAAGFIAPEIRASTGLTNHRIMWGDGETATAFAGHAVIRYKTSLSRIEVAINGGAFTPLGATTFPLAGDADSAGAPDYSWSADPNSGMFNAAADVVGFSAGGTERARVTTAGLQVIDGGAGAPSIAFTSDIDNGLFLAGVNTVGVSTAGTEHARLDATGRLSIGTGISGSPAVAEQMLKVLHNLNLEIKHQTTGTESFVIHRLSSTNGDYITDINNFGVCILGHRNTLYKAATETETWFMVVNSANNANHKSIKISGGATGANGTVIVNEDGESGIDLRVEGDTDVNLLFTDASADTVQVGAATTADSAKFYVSGKVSMSGELEVNGDLNHDGSNVGFYGVAPVARSAGWTITNDSTDRTFDADTATLTDVSDVLATLIRDIAATGLIGAVS